MYYDRYEYGPQLLESTGSTILNYKQWGHGKWSLFFGILGLLFLGAGRILPVLTYIGIVFEFLAVGLVFSLLTREIDLTKYSFLMYILLPFQIWGFLAAKTLQLSGLKN